MPRAGAESADRTAGTNELAVGLVALVVAAGAMAVDHLLGTSGGDGDDFPVDPAMFGISIVLSVATAALLFGWLVPRERRLGPERAARSGLVCSVSSVVPGLALVWVGVPFVFAGAGVALGLEGRQGKRRREATAAVLVGALALVLGALDYLVAALR
jgi:hypothetical protein